jgi:hypothetical protein
MKLPVICIVTAAAKAGADAVWEAWGRGPNTFVRGLCAIDPDATWETPPTHYLMADSSTEESEVAIMQAMANGDLPPISGVWGVAGVVSAAVALASITAANLQVYSASGDVVPVDHMNGILAGRGLQTVPYPPI